MPKNIISGFKFTGIYPFNPNQVDYSKIIMRDKPALTNTPSVTGPTQNMFMSFIEENIDANLSEKFKTVNGSNITWDKQRESLHLFEFWQKIYKSSTSLAMQQTLNESVTNITDDISFIEDHLPSNISREDQSNSLHEKRMPSVLTSQKWIDIQKAKENEKVEIEKRKIDRKAQAALNKQKKAELAKVVKKKKLLAKQKKAEEEKNTKKLRPTRPRSNNNRRKQKQPTPISSEDDDEWISSGNSIMDVSDEEHSNDS